MSNSESGAGGNATWIDFKRIKMGKKIGEGGCGTVYEAILDVNKKVAVKTFQNQDHKTIKREIIQLLDLNHPNIIKIYGATLIEDYIYLVMELADNGSLNDAIHGSSRKPGIPMAISWGLQCAKGVAYLHSNDIIHRDLKPHNCLLFQGKTVLKICDFGLARDVMPSAKLAATGVAQSLTSCGTPGYLAPEVLEGPHFRKKCDVYSWAIMMSEILTGMKPYIEDVKERVQGVPDGLNDLLERCWADDPSKRPSMSEVVKTMEAF